MLDAPTNVTDAEVLAAVRRHWAPEVDNVTYLPVGWGAHHWRADVAGAAALFVTLDMPLPRHTARSLEGAYAGAAAVADELDFVWPSLPTGGGRFTVPMPWGALSVTRWLDGERPDASTRDLAGMLSRLHAATPPPGAPVWSTIVQSGLAEDVAELLSRSWPEPLGPVARELLGRHLDEVSTWAGEHAALLDHADPASYVLTHGEPGVHNHWLAQGRTWLLDWESLLLAPRERDLATLVAEGVEVAHDPALVRVFDLEWRLAEIWSFATWLQQPHGDGADERTALGGLEHELTRPHFGC